MSDFGGWEEKLAALSLLPCNLDFRGTPAMSALRSSFYFFLPTARRYAQPHLNRRENEADLK